MPPSYRNSESRKATLLPISNSSSGFFVNSFHDDARRFIRLFREAVSRVPIDVSEILTKYWQPIGPSSPKIELTELPVITTSDGVCAGIGMTEHSGRAFTFSGPACDTIPDNLGRCLIAHELAHAHTDAQCFFSLLNKNEQADYERAIDSPVELVGLREYYADARMKNWGFDTEEIRQWCGDYLRKNAISLQ
jgi:hypothetical protein